MCGPIYKGDQKSIEAVQRRATKLILIISHLPYEARLRHLNLPSLQHRRGGGDMITVFKIMTGRLNVDRRKFFEMQLNNNTCGHYLKFIKLHDRTFVKCWSFTSRTVNDWNMLPSHGVEVTNVNMFKNALDRHWSHCKFKCN